MLPCKPARMTQMHTPKRTTMWRATSRQVQGRCQIRLHRACMDSHTTLGMGMRRLSTASSSSSRSMAVTLHKLREMGSPKSGSVSSEQQAINA